MAILLSIDSATRHGSVALISDSKLTSEYTFYAKESQSERLLPAIDYVLGTSGVSRSALDCIVVTKGPGSFTGLRIGISVAKGLAHSLEIPVTGLPLSDCYYHQVKFYPGSVCTIIRDRRDLVYFSIFKKGVKQVTEQSESIKEVVNRLEQDYGTRSHPILLVGDGVVKHEKFLQQVSNAIVATGSCNYPSAGQLGLLAAEGPKRDNLYSIEPLYAQRPVAERNFEANSQ